MWRIFNQIIRVHVLAYRLTGGLVGKHIPGVPSMLLLDHVGAKSGTKRTSPLGYVEDGKNYVIVASKGGHARHPAWYHNLKAHPDTTIQVGGDRIPVRASVATSAQRQRLWPKVVGAYGGYAGYQERTKREIPLVILTPEA